MAASESLESGRHHPDPTYPADALGQIVDAVPDIVGACDPQGRMIFLNRAGRRWCGSPDGADAALPDCDALYSPAVAKMIKETALPTAARDGQWRGPSAIRDREGREHPVEQLIIAQRGADGTLTGFATVIHDLSAQRQAEQALRESEARFSKAFYASPDPYIIADFHTNVMLDVNDAYCRIFGVTRTEAIGRRNSELGLWADLTERDRFVDLIARDGEVHEMVQHRLNRAGDPVICRVTAFRADLGGRACTLYRMRDITRERMAEQALRESEEKFSKAFRASPDSIAISTLADGRIIDITDGFTHLHGWSRDEAVGRTVAELGLWGEAAQHDRLMARLRAGEPVHSERIVARDRHGGLHQCLYSGVVIEIAGQPCRISIVRDITDQQRLEDQLRQSQKMESVGQLAGGVAHDFNNVLTVIQGHTSFLLQEASLPAHVRESLQQIQLSAGFAGNLTRQLLLFSRRQVLQPGRVTLRDVVARMTQLLDRVIGENIVLAVTTPPDLPDIQADAGMAEQVLLNLVVNARDAMPRGGRIALTTRVLAIDADYVRRVPQARPGRFVGLSVRDTGEGIPPEVLPRIFDPFFTTKKEGKGTGLGLATVYSIMQQHGGWIEVDSRPGQGTTFEVWFPAVDRATAPPLPAPALPADPRGRETILVVEDKEAVRTVLQAVLERFGYQVVLANDGPEALARWTECKDRIDLLFTDVMMPGGLTGKDLADRLRADRPGLKVVFCSGYDANILDAGALQMAGTRFLTKPFDVSRLTEVVRGLLDAT